ncbi:MAG: hypothetical protein SH856_04595 [Flavobacteriales bacterium]|nr:hypothetical protein [Flavobacteriales bacterium]
MPEAVIVYKESKTLALLKSIGKYLGFEVVKTKTTTAKKEKSKLDKYEGSIPRDPEANIENLRKIFTGRNLDAGELRRKAWERKR